MAGAVAEGGEVRVVGDDDDGLATGVAEAEEEGVDFPLGHAVEVAGGLVREEDGGVVDEGAGDGDALDRKSVV